MNNNYRVKVLKQAGFDDFITKYINKIYFMSFLQNRSHIQELHNKINKCANSYNLNDFVTMYKKNIKTKQVKKASILNFYYTHIISPFCILYKKHYSRTLILGKNLNNYIIIIDSILKISYFDEKEEFLSKLY